MAPEQAVAYALEDGRPPPAPLLGASPGAGRRCKTRGGLLSFPRITHWYVPGAWEESLNSPEYRYISPDYLERNPTWHIEDSPWKAGLVTEVLHSQGLTPESICEVGTGAGGILAELRRAYPRAELFGYDIAPDAARFWKDHENTNIHFRLGDFFELNERTYDVVLTFDVIEHVADLFAFLSMLRARPTTTSSTYPWTSARSPS